MSKHRFRCKHIPCAFDYGFFTVWAATPNAIETHPRYTAQLGREPPFTGSGVVHPWASRRAYRFISEGFRRVDGRPQKQKGIAFGNFANLDWGLLARSVGQTIQVCIVGFRSLLNNYPIE
ncbi:hypothetical protein CDAR_497251 [Caerostris darwini]|uniref:Uncharacterized protein n=1 Tax=Caerostris darwini TaxID=1538125 RepID=A0AAV4S1R3_9ARAC|nr:hypothetical protein CDAR_497251 [Caerostris darwini]